MKELNINGYSETIIERSDFPQEKCKAILKDEVTAILGYGPQGYGQGMNMRDQGYNVILGLRRGLSWDKALSDGWLEGEPASFPAAENADSVGAGDACTAALLTARLLGRDWQDTLNLANRHGAYVANQPSATPSLPQEIWASYGLES